MKEFKSTIVSCHAGYRGEEYPKSFIWDNETVEITKIEKCWLEPGFRYFKVKSAGEDCFQLRYSEIELQWEGQLLSRI